MTAPAPVAPTAETSELAGKVALVTGGASGMGLASARALARLGASVAVADLRPPAQGRFAAFAIDVTKPLEVGAAVEGTLLTFGALHIVINAAGMALPETFDDVTEEAWHRVLDVNLNGTFLVCKAALPALKHAGWGRIVNFSSTAGKVPSTAAGPHYTAAKHAVLGLTRHMAKQVGGDGITVNAVCPGLIDTPMLWSVASETTVSEHVRSFPISRVGEAWEVAELVAFLVSDRAAYITGACIDINGGELIA